MVNAGMVLEGGAMRGVFTAGVLDYLMERDYYCHYVVGVSAGSCNAVDYVSKQIGRTKKCFIQEEKENKYLSFLNMIKGRDLYDLNKVFVDFPGEIYPFDFKTFFASQMECEIVLTNCLTGMPEYRTESRERAKLMDLCRASSSMPLVSPVVMIDQTPYLDGGLTDSVPIVRSMEKGNKKNIVILTRNKGYRKETSSGMMELYKRIYKKYPVLLEVLENRARVYNQTMDLIDRLEEEQEIFVIRPKMKCISRIERNQTKLNQFYEHGSQLMKKRETGLLKYLER